MQLAACQQSVTAQRADAVLTALQCGFLPVLTSPPGVLQGLWYHSRKTHPCVERQPLAQAAAAAVGWVASRCRHKPEQITDRSLEPASNS